MTFTIATLLCVLSETIVVFTHPHSLVPRGKSWFLVPFFFFCMSSVKIERIVEKLKLYGQFSQMGEVSQFTCSRELVCNILG